MKLRVVERANSRFVVETSIYGHTWVTRHGDYATEDEANDAMLALASPKVVAEIEV